MDKSKRVRRLNATEKIASKRQRRYSNYGWQTDKGRFKKWNGTCDCATCKAGRKKHKDKGTLKDKQKEIILGRADGYVGVESAPEGDGTSGGKAG